MAFTQCDVTTNNISELEDQPNDVGGMTAAELKAAFDKFGTDFVEWFNSTHIDEADTHEQNASIHTTYAVTTGPANAYVVTLDPAPSALTEGMAIAVKINVNSTNASTINVNSLGAKAIKKANGGDVTNLKEGGIYTLRYDGTNFILQGEGGEYGTAEAEHVLEDYTIGTEDGIIEGTMINQGQKIYTPGTSNITIPAGYHSGTGYVKGDANLIAANIISGKSIFGVNGNAVATKTASGVVTATGSPLTITVSGLDFTPRIILAINTEYTTSGGLAFLIAYDADVSTTLYISQINDNTPEWYVLDGTSKYVSSSGFKFGCRSATRDTEYKWLAIE